MYTFKKIYVGVAAAATAVLMSSCINDDGIPYPNTKPNFSTFIVENQERGAQIDTINRILTVFLNEAADINGVVVKSFSLSPDKACLVDPSVLSRPLDLCDTLTIELKVYREYAWRLIARQTITRSFTVEGQIGASVIDPETHTVTAVIPDDQPLNAVKVTSIKLGGATATMEPDLLGQTVDFTSPVKVNVTEFGKTTPWTISISQTELSVSLHSVDAWTGVIWAQANAKADSDIKFEYREAGTMQWIPVPTDEISASGAIYTARINGVRPQTEYDVRALNGEEATAPRSVTTGQAVQLPNTRFTDWWKDGAVWDPWAEGDESFWDTGNKGAATLGQSNVTPTDSPEGGYQGATLETKFVGISILGKLAAGSIYAGRFVKVDGTNGILAFGRPYTQRPTAVKARIKYDNVPIDYTTSGFESLKGQPDTCIVWCALWDGAEPYEIRTNPKTRHLFDREDPNVIAYGEFCSGKPIENFTEITIPLEYNATDRVPTMIMLVSAASKYGDYFTGGNGTKMWLSDYELLYEY